MSKHSDYKSLAAASGSHVSCNLFYKDATNYSKDPNKRACTFIFFKKKNRPARSLLETARLFLFLLFLKILIFYIIKLTYLFNDCSFIWVSFYPARNFLLYLPVGGHAYLRGLCYQDPQSILVVLRLHFSQASSKHIPQVY